MICIKDLLFKVKDAQMSPKCQWKLGDKIIAGDGDEIKTDDVVQPGDKIEAGYKNYNCKKGNNTFELSISQFKTNYVGKYECIISPAKECTVQPTVVSTAVKVFVELGKCTDMICMIGILNLVFNFYVY